MIVVPLSSRRWMVGACCCVVAGLLSCESDAFVNPTKSLQPTFHPRRHQHQIVVVDDSTTTSCRRLFMSASLSSVFDELSAKVMDKLGLQTTDFTESYDAKTWTSPNGVSGTAEWLAEASPKYLTGVSLLTTKKEHDNHQQQEWTINIWLGPSYDVPHLLLTFGHDTSSAEAPCSILADYIPRGATPLGSDGQYLEAFYGPDVQDAWTKAYSVATAVPAMPSPAWTSRLLASPLRINVKGLDEATTVELVQGHVDRLLSWLDQAQPIAARLRGSFNLRDDKLRQYYFRGQMQEQVALLGADLGKVVAAANTGPTAEAYVGGGS